MQQELPDNLILPVFKAISSRASRTLTADYFAFIILNTNRDEYKLLLNRKIDNLSEYEKELKEAVISVLTQYKNNEYDSLCESKENPDCNPICRIFTDKLDCNNVLQVPFKIDDKNGGVLVWCWNKLPSDFSKEYTEKAIFITELAALSLKLLLEERQSQELNTKLAALLELSTAIYSSLNYKEVLEKTINLSMKIVGADGGTVFILDKKTNLLEPLITVDEEHEEQISKITLKLGEGITGLVAQSGLGVISNHSESDPRTYHVPGTPEDEPESLICAPLTWSGDVIGTVTLRSISCKQFIQDDLDILTIFARQTADAIENARLFESLEKAYKELSNTQEQLIMTEKLRALGEMAGGVAHDFNNALGIILGRVQLLLHEITDEKLVKQLQQIETVTLDGAKTVQKLQNFTRVSQSGQFEHVDLNKVISNAIEAAKPRWKDECQHRGINIELNFNQGELPLILGNKTDLVEAFSNIILNAVDALPEGGCIKIVSYKEDDKAKVTITDNGRGMGEATLNRIFFPFYTTKGKQGTGMGLAVVYGIVTRHKGEIDVTSKPGRGTTFMLSFPTTGKVKSEVKPQVDIKEEIKANVLVIDDDESIRNVVGDILKYLGHSVSVAATGEEGVKLFKENDFDIVITDLGMPGISGWEVTRICKSLKFYIPVIMISGWGNQIDEEMIKQSKLDGILTKPFEMKKIKNAIQKALINKLQSNIS